MWCNFETSPCEDETISNNFASRGMFKLRSDELIEVKPSVQAAVQSKQMVIAIDKCFVLVEEDMETKCSFLSFNSNIDAFTVSQSGNIIICGLNNGEIHGVFIKGVPLFSLCIQTEDISKSGKTFVCLQEINNRFYLICTNGSIYRLSAIDEGPLSTLVDTINTNETVAFEESLMENIVVERLISIKNVSGICSAVLFPQPSNEHFPKEHFGFIAGTEQEHTLVFGTTSSSSITRLKIPELYGGTKSIYNADNYILLLTKSGHLLEVCPVTKMISLNSISNEILIDELIVMESTDLNIEFLVLTKVVIDAKKEDVDRFIKFIQYPSLKCLNEFEVSQVSWIVQQPKCAVNLYYLKGMNFNTKNYPTEIEMMSVSETHPSERFKKLVAKGHLKEAEEYGKHFELSLQPVYEANARHLLIQLQSFNENNPEIFEQCFTKLIELLEKIENRDFFRNNRTIDLASRKMLNKFLNELLKRLDEDQDESDVLKIHEQLRRLETLSIVDPYECDIEWQTFVHSENLMKYLMPRLKSDIPVACLIWKRHSSAIVPNLNQNYIQKLLDVIPKDTEAFHLIQWLRQFVPIISNTHPECMSHITDWGIQKTRALQYSKHWPEIGLEFCTKVLEIMEETEFMHFDVRRHNEQNIGKLQDVVNALQELSVLSKSYNIIFTLDNYQKESVCETAFCILQRIHLTHLKGLVNDFLYPIFQEKGQSPVKALRRYINLMVASRNTLSTWLERAVECVELLHDEDDRLECALSILQCAPVPWPETVASLIKLRFSTHPLASKINSEFEMQAIKIMKAKYGWPTDNAGDSNLSLFMFRVVKMDLPDMFNDIRILTQAAPEITTSANFNACYQSVKRGKLENAYNFFKSINLDNQKDVVEVFADLLENGILVSETKWFKEQEQLIEFFSSVIIKSCHSSLNRLHQIKHRFVLFQKFGIKSSSVNEIFSLEKRTQLLELGIEFIISQSDYLKESNRDITNYFMNEIIVLTNALEMHKIKGVRSLCRKLKCLQLSCSLAYAVLDADDCCIENCTNFVDLAFDLLVQQILTDKNNSSSTLPSMSILSTANDPLTFPLAYELLVRASLHEKQQTLQILEFIKYISVVNMSYPLNIIHTYYGGRTKEINEIIVTSLNAKNKSSNSDCGDVSFDVSMLPETKGKKKRESVSVFDKIEVEPLKTKNVSFSTDKNLITRFVGQTLVVLVLSTNSSNVFFSKFSSFLLAEEEKLSAEDALKSFFLLLEQIIKIKEYNVFYIIAQYLLNYQENENCSIIASDFVTMQLVRMFRFLMSHTDCNFIDIFAMLMADKHTEKLLEKMNRDLRSDQQKLNFLTLHQMYNLYLEEDDQVSAISHSRLKQYYYMEFCKQDPTIKGKFNMAIDNIEKLLKEFHNKKLDVNLLERISRDFELDLDHMLILQVISIFQSQEMQYEIKIDSFGEEELITITTVEGIRSLCQPYIDKIKNIELLTSKLKQFISEINVYFYELYLCVLEILSFIDVVPPEMRIWTNILHFLKHKLIRRRRNRPGQLETDLWLQSSAEIGVLPKIARFRLPFTPIVEHPLKDILDSELTIDNCESWFPLIDLHTMLKSSKDVGKMRDYFCMTAVKNSINEYKSKDDTEIWHIQPTNNAFLKSILRLIKNVTNPAKAFMILYFVSNYAPEGADQVEATFESYKYALEHEALIKDQKYQEQLTKIKRKYPILKTQHLLYVHGLTDENLLHLVESPEKLIYNLYHHDLILKPSKLEINSVIKEISNLHGINLEVIQYQLLQKWLSFTQELADGTILEETFLEDHHLSRNTNEDVENFSENVSRAFYILSSWPKEEAVQLLIAHIFSSEGAPNPSKQLQMYECLSKLDGGSNSLQHMLDQRKYITIKCVHELKQLGYNSSVEKFANCNKIDILKTIWQRNAQDPKTLKILANICLGYDIYLARIWNGILKRMTLNEMIHELNALVDTLSCKPQLLHIEGLVIAWDYVLEHPFKNANQTRSFKQEELLHKALFRLQSCPVLEKLNLLNLAMMCIRLERPHIAAVLMTLSKNEKERNDIKEVVLLKTSKNLRQEISDLEEAGILPSILNYTLKELEM